MKAGPKRQRQAKPAPSKKAAVQGASRRTQAERREASMTRILDKAEELFSQHGYYGVTLNDVAKHSGTDAALMRYYFGDKEQLFHALFARRADIANTRRMAALEAYEAKMGEAMTLEGAIDAFIRPAFELMEEDDGWRNYGAIVAYVNSSRGQLRELMSEAFDPVSHKLIAMFRRMLPHASDQEIFWGYHFLTGAFTYSLGQSGRIDALSGGVCSSSEFGAISDRLPKVLAAGIEAICAAPPKSAKKKTPQSKASAGAKRRRAD